MSSGLKIAFAAGSLVLVATIAALGWPWLSPLFVGSSADATQILDIRLGSKRLAVPAAYIRDEESRRSGEFGEIDIAASATDFRPVLRPAKLRPGVEDASANIVYFQLREQEKSIDPAERPARLYVRFLEQDQWTHPGGLVMRRFEPGSPFDKEDLYMAPPEGRLFAARCLRPRQPPDGLPNTCVAELRISGIDVRLRFSPNLLSEWENLVAGTRGLVQSMSR